MYSCALATGSFEALLRHCCELSQGKCDLLGSNGRFLVIYDGIILFYGFSGDFPGQIVVFVPTCGNVSPLHGHEIMGTLRGV